MKEIPLTTELIPGAPKEGSGVRVKPQVAESTAEEREDKEHRQRLIVGATKHILKNLYAERNIIDRILALEQSLSRANTKVYELQPEGLWQYLFRPTKEKEQFINAQKKAAQFQQELVMLEQDFQREFIQIDSDGRPIRRHPNLRKRLKALHVAIAKQEVILLREKAHLKTAPKPEST